MKTIKATILLTKDEKPVGLIPDYENESLEMVDHETPVIICEDPGLKEEEYMALRVLMMSVSLNIEESSGELKEHLKRTQSALRKLAEMAGVAEFKKERE